MLLYLGLQSSAANKTKVPDHMILSQFCSLSNFFVVDLSRQEDFNSVPFTVDRLTSSVR